MPDVTDYKKEWENIFHHAYAEGRRHWRPDLATPPCFREFLQSPLAPPAGSRVIEAGCADGLNAVFLAEKGFNVTGVDISSEAIARARETAHEHGVSPEFLRLDLARDPFPDNREFDLWVDIKTLHVLWEDRDRGAYLDQVKRVLRNGGLLFLNGALALADVKDYFPGLFASLHPSIREGAGELDRNLPRSKRTGVRCETLGWYCSELVQAGFVIRDARREASVGGGWGAIVIAEKKGSHRGHGGHREIRGQGSAKQESAQTASRVKDQGSTTLL